MTETATDLYAVCPSDVVHAPIGVVWALLTDASGWGAFFDARVLDVAPAGPAIAGQRVRVVSGRWPLRFRLEFAFTEVDAAHHTLKLEICLPFGIRNHEHLVCSVVDDQACRVSYGCNFEFPHGARGAVLKAMTRRAFESGPADSLARLKHQAEAIFAQRRL